ncbi:MAG TPA: fused MFS/spermidine synthase [Pirellulales bacterium]|nr:fused MFS/spermidine synthase [Pirellulales bacterium]
MAILFSITLFVAAALLFAVEPLVGKLLLPKFGGAPAVWNTCLVFFQASLLAGYGYAHLISRGLPRRVRVALHLLVVAAAWLALPIATSPRWLPPGGASPTPWLLAMLAASAGLPFFAVSATAPLLQTWFAGGGHRQAHDPYFLYAASNAGSMIGLLAYPTLIEPNLPLTSQGRAWAIGYALLCALIAACAAVFWRSPAPALPRSVSAVSRSPAGRQAPGTSTRARWVALAFVPSSLLLAVTAHLSSDVSPVPLMWVAPLALYLLSFILVFARLPGWVHRLMTLALPAAILAQAYFVFTEEAGMRYPMGWLASLHLAVFFVAAMVCHGELARTRPAALHLTEFYFWMSLGGVLGGLFNALLAPLLFQSMFEYPLGLALACMLAPPLCARPNFVAWRPFRRLAQAVRPRHTIGFDLAAPVVIGLAAATILFRWSSAAGRPEDSRWPALAVIALCVLAAPRPVRFGLSVAAVFWTASWYDDVVNHLVARERGFYGVLQVRTDGDEEFYYLDHGHIRHGQQRRSEDPVVRDVPLIYYHPDSPIGQVFHAWSGRTARQPVAVVGLGVGSLAAYGEPGQRFTFFEIDPAVEQFARDANYFTYLADSRADCRVVLGDARLSLDREPDGRYGLIVVDAFSGDAIPVHLLTREALELYLRKLSAGGVAAFHISNQFLDLAPVLGNLAQDLRLVGLDQLQGVSPKDLEEGKSDSHWVVIARSREDLQWLAGDDRWQSLAARPELPLWTDDYTSLWGIAHLGRPESAPPP